MKKKYSLSKKTTRLLNQLKVLPSIVLAILVTAVSLTGCGGSDSGSSPSSSVAPSPAPSPAPAAVSTAPTITTQPANTTVTELQPTSFSVIATGGAPLSYQWRRNGVTVAGATSATLAITSAVAADHSAKYSAVVTNSASSVTSTEAVLSQVLPMFLMAGQSNMEGNADSGLFQSLLIDLADSTITDMKISLAERIRVWHQVSNNGYANYGYSPKMAAFEASELVRLNAAGLMGSNLTTPNAKILCSWNTTSVAPLVFSTSAKRCGGPGPELMFGQKLYEAGYSSTSLIKVAYGGTNLYSDWRSPLSGGTASPKNLYAQLRARIQSLKLDPASVNPACKNRACQWSAFIWFQGEADSDSNPQKSSANADAYEQNLKNLIADVRNDAGLPTLPVVIIQTGAWAQSLTYGLTIAAAQTAVVKQDKYARLVNTADLSGFYHYDPAAQLIIGERVALAVKSLLAAAPATQ